MSQAPTETDQIDFSKIYGELHFQLRAAERLDTQIHAFKELTGRECVAAHNILVAMDSALKARWEKLGKPSDDELT